MNTDLLKDIDNIQQALASVVTNGPTRYALDASWKRILDIVKAAVPALDKQSVIEFPKP